MSLDLTDRAVDSEACERGCRSAPFREEENLLLLWIVKMGAAGPDPFPNDPDPHSLQIRITRRNRPKYHQFSVNYGFAGEWMPSRAIPQNEYADKQNSTGYRNTTANIVAY